MHDTIVILDFGSQYSQSITRLVRSLQVYCELMPWDHAEGRIKTIRPKGFILSGGPASVYEKGAPYIPRYIFEAELPVLGICYGMQAITHALGGVVSHSPKREYGQAVLKTVAQNSLIPPGEHFAWMSHGDRIDSLPDGFITLAKTDHSPHAAICNLEKNYYGVQFHPEVQHTPNGKEIIRKFVLDICGAKPDWSPESIITTTVRQIREKVGEAHIISAVSGGVDSSVATAIVHKAVGDKLTAVFVDNGLLRKNEPENVVSAFRERMGMQLIPVNAVEIFMDALSGITDPEMKRQVIGERFIRVFEEQARKSGSPRFLVQGTIYPDVVESSAPDRSQAHRIKSHHNVGGLPETMDFDLVEPLRYLFKDEVRSIGEKLGLPSELVWRQPFPGPGLAVRCLGEVTWERLKKLREADAILREELKISGNLVMKRKNQQVHGTAQAFAVLLPIRSVGVMGDQRTYQEVIALRAVTSEDFMTADWARLSHPLLAKISQRIVNEVDGINRVVYDITSKPPATIEWE